MMKIFLALAILVGLLWIQQAAAHCEIPCGVFDDGARFDSIMEHATTIEKSMNAINELSAADKVDYHMIARRTHNKEEHARKIQDIVSQYFLTQRVKAPKGENVSDEDEDNYITHITLLHQMLVAAMKTKQTLDIQNVEILRDLTNRYKEHYFKKHGHEH